MNQAETDTTQENPPADARDTQPRQRPVSAWSAEAFAVAALVLNGAALLGTRLVRMLAAATGADRIGVAANTALGDGATAVLGAVLGLVALLTAHTETRPWARWIAAAALVLSVITVAASVVTFFLLPEPQPQPTVPGLG